jgi:ABC-type lipoprotein release transport system permease subunit
MAISTGAAILGSAAVGAAASIFGGKKQADASKDAAKAQLKATKATIAQQERALERQIGLQEPFRQTGVSALPEYETASAYTPFSMNAFNADPGYQFRMSESMKALERSAAARGILQSGGTLKDITRFGQDAASQEYQNAFQRYLAERQQKLQPLEYRIGLGQNAASNQGANIGSTAQNVGNLTASTGNIRSAGIMGQANAFTNTMSNITGLASDAANAYGQYQAAQPYQNYLSALASTGSSSGLGVAPPPGYAMPRI